jgi:hypothetical protein
VIVRFLCPGCENPGRGEAPSTEPWPCPSCDHVITLAAPQTTTHEGLVTLHSCVVCGNHELYKEKDFPHWLGLSILTVSIIGFIWLMALRLQWWAWTALLASLVIDCALYYWLVNDAVVCYRCGARHSGVGRAGNAPFELTIHERYRQERQYRH